MNWQQSVVLLGAVIVLFGCSGSDSVRRSETARADTVHTGYGAEAKSQSTSATSTVAPTEHEGDRATDFHDLLRGQAAGVQVRQTTGGLRVTIRGVTSVNADTTPLYVLDGMSIEPGPNGTIPVLPQDVKSITVLKDAAATAMYGTRGANGVIVIETKDR